MEAITADEDAQKLYFFKSIELYIFSRSICKDASMITPTSRGVVISAIKKLLLQSQDLISCDVQGMSYLLFKYIARSYKITWNQDIHRLGMNQCCSSLNTANKCCLH